MKKLFGCIKKCSPYLLLFLIPAVNFYLLEWYTHDPFSTMEPRVQLLNILLFEVLALFLFALTGRINSALMIQTAFCAIYGLAGFYVLEFRGVPIQPWDLLSLGTAASVADNYDYSLDRDAAISLLSLIALFLLEFFIKARFPRRKAAAKEGPSGRKFRFRPWQARLLLGAFSGLLLSGYTKMLHNETIVQTKLRLYDKLFTPTTIQYKDGTLTAFLMELQYISVEKPAGYSDEKAQEILASYGSRPVLSDSSKNSGHDTASLNQSFSRTEEEAEETSFPNIIVIMNEAFSDPAVLGELSTNEDYMPFVHSLLDGADNTVSGYLNVSVKGGNTANTEFEYLTGHTMAFLPYGSIPYQQYIKKEHPSLASHLSSLGYYTVAMHPYHASGWNRDTVYPDLGFEELHFEEFFQDVPKVRKYTSDLGDYEKLIDVFENKPGDQPLFLFNVTMQNHSSYSDWDDYDNFTPDITVDGSSSKLLPAYLSLMKLSDEAIEGLVNYFSMQDEDTMIVFFGDHQPTDSIVNPVLALYDKSCSDLTAEEEYLRYQVPFFIWANFDIEEETGVEISPNFLGTKTLETAGLPLSSYFSFLSDLNEDVSVLSASRVLLSDGTATDIDAQEDLLSDYKTLQYYLLFDQ